VFGAVACAGGGSDVARSSVPDVRH
jgi:hypothetical protein